MSKKKKLAIAAAVLTAALGVGGYLGFKPAPATAKLVGQDLQQCEANCGQPCECMQSCFVVWCWGGYYCNCAQN